MLIFLAAALSDLGRIAYIHYWSQTLARTILTCPSKKIVTVQDLREKTYIVPEDIIATLQTMDVLEQKKKGGADAVINKARVRAWADTHKVDLKAYPVDPESPSYRYMSDLLADGYIGELRSVRMHVSVDAFGTDPRSAGQP